MNRSIRTLLIAAGAAFATTAIPTAAFAAPPDSEPMTFDCAGLGQVEVQVPATDQDNWGAGRVVGGGNLIPLSFEWSVYDETVGTYLFDNTVSRASGRQPQATTTCSMSQSGELDQLAPPDQPVPDGAQPTDQITITFTATVIAKP